MVVSCFSFQRQQESGIFVPKHCLSSDININNTATNSCTRHLHQLTASNSSITAVCRFHWATFSAFPFVTNWHEYSTEQFLVKHDTILWDGTGSAGREYFSIHYGYTGLFKMIVGVLTTWHTQYTWDRIIFYLIERHSKFLLHTLQVNLILDVTP